MNGPEWLAAYFESYRASLFPEGMDEQLIALKELLQATQARGAKVIMAGNGGSAAIASHCAVDFTKNAGIRCINFNEASLVTCLANDHGYEHWLAEALRLYADDGDLVLLISSSGRSPNMLRASDYAAARGLTLATFTGFLPSNPLRARGQINFYVPSRSYNVVEMTHHIWLLAACDLIIAETNAAPPAAPLRAEAAP